ncbi:hypothetical protein PRIPAC_81604 [Pristionchus pacificus]|uniref:Uncharacterized protein n=1 Tax=Pristionchus pacificus TaxID=54126 RepID=A0A2A6BVX0_PRIPA|nr:hypothetical protein PRIPAC_81604 [Pristionchus pacificus]|eukprot:PDM69976.1 hypothetical protein PRIPAC_49188 [Pristionchus pacificus]
MEVDEEERTQNETASYHSLRTSLSLDDLRTALHHSCASPCKTAISLTRIVEGPDRWRQLLRVVDQEELLADNRFDSDSTVQRALETVIASSRTENDEPTLSTARRHSFQLSDGDNFVLEVPSTTLDQYDDPWAPPNTPVDEEGRFLVDCTTTCSTMQSISPSASRERIAGEVAEYLLVKESESAPYRVHYLSMGR